MSTPSLRLLAAKLSDSAPQPDLVLQHGGWIQNVLLGRMDAAANEAAKYVSMPSIALWSAIGIALQTKGASNLVPLLLGFPPQRPVGNSSLYM